MKFFLALSLFVLSVSAFAQTKMSEDAVEMFSVLSHHQVQDCMKDVEKMVNVSIVKEVARCPGCNTYKITGNTLNIDMVNPEQTVITIRGSSSRTTFGFNQTYTCSIKN